MHPQIRSTVTNLIQIRRVIADDGDLVHQAVLEGVQGGRQLHRVKAVQGTRTERGATWGEYD